MASAALSDKSLVDDVHAVVIVTGEAPLPLLKKCVDAGIATDGYGRPLVAPVGAAGQCRAGAGRLNERRQPLGL